MLYFLLGGILSIFSFLEIISKNRNFFNILFFILLLLMLFMVGFRDGRLVGTDSPAYYVYYLEKLPPAEFGYKYLNYFFSSNGFPYTVFLLFINAVALINIGRFIKFNSYYLILPLLVFYSDFFFYYNFSGIRQAIALSFTALSLYYVFENKKSVALILILIASLFHITALIFILAFFVPKIKMSFAKYMKFIIVVLSCVLIGSLLIDRVPYLSQKFLYYSSVQEQADNIVNSYYIGVVKRLIVLVAVILVYKKFFSENKNFYIYNLYLIGFLIYVVSYLISPEFGVRLGAYFIILDCILIARYVYASNSVTNKIVLFLVFSIIALYKIYTYTLLATYDYHFLNL